tara:strand:- start:1985 stop:2422 length:438 start_codon:yes stop_codon:yes gene_type:complete
MRKGSNSTKMIKKRNVRNSSRKSRTKKYNKQNTRRSRILRHKRSKRLRKRLRNRRNKTRTNKMNLKRQRGGRILSPEFINLGKGIGNDIENIANVFRGADLNPSPLPTKDHPIAHFDEKNFGKLAPVDVVKTYDNAINEASNELA